MGGTRAGVEAQDEGEMTSGTNAADVVVALADVGLPTLRAVRQVRCRVGEGTHVADDSVSSPEVASYEGIGVAIVEGSCTADSMYPDDVGINLRKISDLPGGAAELWNISDQL